MIKMLRLDESLIHCQVVCAWIIFLVAFCIFLFNDDVADNKLRMTSLKLAAPGGVKFVAKSVDDAIELLNGNKTDKYKLFLIVDNTADALRLVKEVKDVDHVNLGNMKVKEGAQALTPSIAVTEADVENIREMLAAGAEVECRAVPTDKKIMVETLI